MIALALTILIPLMELSLALVVKVTSSELLLVVELWLVIALLHILEVRLLHLERRLSRRVERSTLERTLRILCLQSSRRELFVHIHLRWIERCSLRLRSRLEFDCIGIHFLRVERIENCSGLRLLSLVVWERVLLWDSIRIRWRYWFGMLLSEMSWSCSNLHLHLHRCLCFCLVSLNRLSSLLATRSKKSIFVTLLGQILKEC